MRFSEVKKHKVVSSSTAETVARLKEFLVDPATRSVAGLRLRKSKSGDLLRWQDLAGFGTEAITITGADKLSESDEQLQALSGKAHAVLGKRVLSTGGDELGSVTDVEFDPQSGSLVSLLLEAETVAASRLVGIGSYAVVVDEAH